MVKLVSQASLTVSFLVLGLILFWCYPNEEAVRITLLFVEFEEFANNVSATCSALGIYFPSLLVVSDTLPYPPLNLTPPARLHVTAPGIGTPLLSRVPADLVTTSHVLLLPDFLSVSDAGRVAALATARPAALLALPAGSVTCERLRLSLRQWTLQYSVAGAGEACDSVAGPHALLIPVGVMWQLSDPFCRPSPECLYVQTKHAGLKVELADPVLLSQGSGPASPRQRDKLRQYRRHRRAQFYRWAGVRRVWRGGRWRWHGCTRHTPRCFPSIVDDTPDYLYAGRWTPPCCLRHLRRTARHVFAALRRCRARFWLEGGSLLGAVRNSDIIPWDSDVDIGIYEEDIPGCPYLHAAVKGAVSDPDGFVWEKAPEGRFFRVQYSVANRVHVDVFPFYSNNGTMTKDTWFETHPQDCEFPEHYLRPLETLPFVGVNVTVPNNAREFLELKFGKGVIETPKYPMPDRVPFPSEIESSGDFYGEATFPGSEDEDSELST